MLCYSPVAAMAIFGKTSPPPAPATPATGLSLSPEALLAIGLCWVLPAVLTFVTRSEKSPASSAPSDGARDQGSWPEFPVAESLRHRCAALSGPNVLDVSASNILDYACGAWALVVHDIVAIMGEEAGAAVLKVIDTELEMQQAFALRAELCNLKVSAEALPR